jgi:uncharacterized membrane protein
MIGGYCVGVFYSSINNASRRSNKLLLTGMLLITIFLVLRIFAIYGDAPWSIQGNTFNTVLSFFNITKYPVSLLFALFTVGVVLIALAAIDRTRLLFSNVWMVFGRVPLFYYIVHFFLIHTSALIFSAMRTGKSFSEIDFHFDKSFGGIIPGEGISLVWVYVIWMMVIAVMYPLCRMYDHYKRTHHYKWLSYL